LRRDRIGELGTHHDQVRRRHFRERLVEPSSADHGLCRASAFAADLAADQIVRLDTGRAFVNRCDPRVAMVLRGTGLLMNPCPRGSDAS
jgi:hypothetical protein